MRFSNSIATIFAIVGTCIGTCAFAESTISIKSLLEEMVNRDAIAMFPSPAYTCRQFSSYDRDSADPNARSTWFANWDRSQFLRTDQVNGRQEHVMMDADGPGAIVRFWCTWDGAS